MVPRLAGQPRLPSTGRTALGIWTSPCCETPVLVLLLEKSTGAFPFCGLAFPRDEASITQLVNPTPRHPDPLEHLTVL